MPYNSLIKDPSLPVTNPTLSYWQVPPDGKLSGIKSQVLPSQCDIAVIGSGISACSVTRELLTGGFTGKITVLEAREICSGATGRNGGRIHVHAVQDYDKFRQKFGDEAAQKIVRFQMAHYDALKAVAQSLGPEMCKRAAIRQTESVAAVFSEKKLDEIKTLVANFEAAFPDWIGHWKIVDAEEAQKKYKIQHAKGAMIGMAGAAWPYRLITGVFTKLLEDYGDCLSLEAKTPVLAVSKDCTPDFPYTLTTARGAIRAKHVIYCTEAHTAHLLPKFRGILVPRRGQMSVQTPGAAFEDLKGKRSWNFYFDQGFDYFHQNPTTGDIFIGGGELGGLDSGLEVFGIPSDAIESIPAKAHLSGILRVIFGTEAWGDVPSGQQSMKSSWCGTLGNSLDHVPLVGILPQEAFNDRRIGNQQDGAEWISVGFGGYGMTNSWLCGVALARQVLGEGVPSWLPEQYRITSARMFRLQVQLAEIRGTEKHLRALM